MCIFVKIKLMSKNTSKLEQLKKLLYLKKSNDFYASKLNISVLEVEKLRNELRQAPLSKETTIKHNIEKGSFEFTGYYTTAPTPEQIIKDHKIDLNQWKLSSFWSKQKGTGYYVSAFFKAMPKEEKALVSFTETLKNFKSPHVPFYIKKDKLFKQPQACLIFNMQDAHWNKYDNNGKNNMNDRFSTVYSKMSRIVNKASFGSNLQKIIYVLGSDQFNSEYTGTTTKGTPQSNLFTYEESFEKIAKNEITVINFLLEKAENVEVIYVPGNHDHFVGWHLVQFLSAYFRNQKNLMFDTEQKATKYRRYQNTDLQFNHGDVLKDEKLAQLFPMDFKHEWSICDHFISMVGDKHHEVAKDLNGIKFYQLPALSSSKSTWDDKQGFSCKGEMMAFLILEKDGITDIYHEKI